MCIELRMIIEGWLFVQCDNRKKHKIMGFRRTDVEETALYKKFVRYDDVKENTWDFEVPDPCQAKATYM